MPQKGLLLPSAEDLTAPRTFTCSLGDLKLLPLRLEIASEDLKLLPEDLKLLPKTFASRRLSLALLPAWKAFSPQSSA